MGNWASFRLLHVATRIDAVFLVISWCIVSELTLCSFETEILRIRWFLADSSPCRNWFTSSFKSRIRIILINFNTYFTISENWAGNGSLSGLSFRLIHNLTSISYSFIFLIFTCYYSVYQSIRYLHSQSFLIFKFYGIKFKCNTLRVAWPCYIVVSTNSIVDGL